MNNKMAPKEKTISWPLKECCRNSGELIECDGETDKWKCPICGNEWESTCHVDDDYS